jgi:hypothetical protein
MCLDQKFTVDWYMGFFLQIGSTNYSNRNYKVFQEIRLLSNLFNIVHQKELLPLFQVAAMICPSIAM